jgi:hypothetical protein
MVEVPALAQTVNILVCFFKFIYPMADSTGEGTCSSWLLHAINNHYHKLNLMTQILLVRQVGEVVYVGSVFDYHFLWARDYLYQNFNMLICYTPLHMYLATEIYFLL